MLDAELPWSASLLWGGEEANLPCPEAGNKNHVGCLGAPPAPHDHTESSAAGLALAGCPPRRRWPCSVSSVCKAGGRNVDPPRWGVSPFGFAAPVLQCPKEEVADRLCSSFCRESTVHPSSGACPGSGCQCPGCQCLRVVYARNKGSSWAVVRCLRPGPRSQTQPWRDSCAGVCSRRCFPGKKGLAVFMAGLFPPAFEVSQQSS